MNSGSGTVKGTLTRYKRAWLITWDWAGDHAEVKDRFVAVLDYRYSSETVRQFVEWVYASRWLSFYEQLAFAKHRNSNPYRAQFGTIETRGEAELPPRVRYPGQITCGANPWLWARLVHNLEAWVDQSGSEHLTWRQRLYTTLENGELASDWEKCEITR